MALQFQKIHHKFLKNVISVRVYTVGVFVAVNVHEMTASQSCFLQLLKFTMLDPNHPPPPKKKPPTNSGMIVCLYVCVCV